MVLRRLESEYIFCGCYFINIFILKVCISRALSDAFASCQVPFNLILAPYKTRITNTNVLETIINFVV